MDKLAKVYYSTVNTELKFQEMRIALESERSGKTGNICEFDNGLVGSNDMTAFRKACRHFKHGKKLEDIKKYEAVRIDADPGKPEGFAGEVMLQSMNNHHASVTEWGQSFITAEKPRHILDIGCGGGAALEKISGIDGKMYDMVCLHSCAGLGSLLYNLPLLHVGLVSEVADVISQAACLQCGGGFLR